MTMISAVDHGWWKQSVVSHSSWAQPPISNPLWAKRRAELWLSCLRGMQCDFDTIHEFLVEDLAIGNLTLEQIGSSVQEIKEIKNAMHILTCCRCLEQLRHGSDCYAPLLDEIRTRLDEIGMPLDLLEPLGTSESELERLRVLGCEVSARKWLALLRKNPRQGRAGYDYMVYMLCDLKRGGLKIEAIGLEWGEFMRIARAVGLHTEEFRQIVNRIAA